MQNQDQNINKKKDKLLSSMALLTYSHSSFQDVLSIYFIQLSKYFPSISGYLLVDKLLVDIPRNQKIIYYNDKLSYYNHLLKALSIIEKNYVLYMQDDYFLINKPNYNILNKVLIKLESEDLDFVRLIRTGNDIINIENNIFHHIDKNSTNLFSTQATIWKKKSLNKLLKYASFNNKNDNIWMSEINLNKVSKILKINGMFLYNNENKRGKNHWDSSFFPYISTAIIKGRWNLKEYKKELMNIFVKNYVCTKRGNNINSLILNFFYYLEFNVKKYVRNIYG